MVLNTRVLAKPHIPFTIYAQSTAAIVRISICSSPLNQSIILEHAVYKPSKILTVSLYLISQEYTPRERMIRMKYTYRSTLYACYTGYITQAIVNNLAPLFFVIFQNRYGLSFEQVGRIILINFVVQIATDILSVKFLDSIGYRKAAVFAHILCTVGLVFLAVLPNIFPDPYIGIIVSVVFYACGGGLLEVLVSPIVNALPGDQKESAMSLLHSFYCWGQVSVVLFTTLLLSLLGHDYWPLLPLLWALVPFYNLFRFLKVPLAPVVPDNEKVPLKKLFQSKFFLIVLLMMLCAGAGELTMSQWSSLFAEKGLHLPKVLGDLLGPCLFAVFMGIGRTIYGFWGS